MSGPNVWPRATLALGVERDEPVGDLGQLLGDARLGARPIGAAHLGQARRGAFARAVLGDLVHLVHRHQHAIGAGVLEVEVVARRAEDRLGAQAEILPDPVHRVHDVVADPQIGQRDRDAFLDRAQLDALGRLPEDLAVAEHVQVQGRDREAGFDRALIDEDAAGARHHRDAVGPGRAQVQQRGRALDGHAGAA